MKRVKVDRLSHSHSPSQSDRLHWLTLPVFCVITGRVKLPEVLVLVLEVQKSTIPSSYTRFTFIWFAERIPRWNAPDIFAYWFILSSCLLLFDRPQNRAGFSEKPFPTALWSAALLVRGINCVRPRVFECSVRSRKWRERYKKMPSVINFISTDVTPIQAPKEGQLQHDLCHIPFSVQYE